MTVMNKESEYRKYIPPEFRAPETNWRPSRRKLSMDDPARLICYCYKVDVAAIEAAVAAGKRDIESVQEHTGACMGCGSCSGDLDRAILRAISRKRASRGGQQTLPL